MAPDWAELSIELKKPGVTLLILWEEYRSDHPDGYGCPSSNDLRLFGLWKNGVSGSVCGLI